MAKVTAEQREAIRRCQGDSDVRLCVISENVCSRCKRYEVVSGKKQCERCLKWLTDRRLRNKASGVCPNCGRELEVGFTKCTQCRSKSAELRRSDVQSTIEAYGGYVCLGCGETEPIFLTLDHIDNDGGGSKRVVRGSGFYTQQRKSGYKDRIQILCFNCNLAKSRNKGVLVDAKTAFCCSCKGSSTCSHGLSASARSRRRLFLTTLDQYGGQACTCCGEDHPFKLTLDHGDDNGGRHRAEMGNKTDLAAWLRAAGHPQDRNIKVLCANCNSGRARNGGTCPHRRKS